MARTILGEYGPDTPKIQHPSMTTNRPVECRDVLNYQPPVGPLGLGRNSPGIGHVEPGYGTEGEEAGEETGSPGNHGTNHGNCGSQGSR